jgi:CelD/BcsL family acetyltransferase involved in cellulose biosynthesis
MNEIHSAVAAAYERRPPKPTIEPCVLTRSEALHGARIAVYSDLAFIEAAWRNFERRAVSTAFQNFDYLSAWQRHIGKRGGVTPAIVVVETGDTIHAIFPLAIDGPGLLRRLTWLGQDLCDYLAPLLTQEFARIDHTRFRALWREIELLLQSDRRFRHDWADLRKMPARIAENANPPSALPAIPHPSPGHVATLAGDWNGYYCEHRTAKARKQDRSKLSRLAEIGDVTLHEPSQPDEAVRILETLFAQKADALQRKGIADFFERPGHREFFLDLAGNPRLRDIVHVSALAVGPALAAINLGMEYKGRYSLFLVSYDRTFARLSPGVIHLNKLLERAIVRGLNEFDFLVGEQRLKLEWADREIELYDHIAASTFRGVFPALLARLFTRAKRVVKQTPWLWSAFRQLRTAAASLRRRR